MKEFVTRVTVSAVKMLLNARTRIWDAVLVTRSIDIAKVFPVCKVNRPPDVIVAAKSTQSGLLKKCSCAAEPLPNANKLADTLRPRGTEIA